MTNGKRIPLIALLLIGLYLVFRVVALSQIPMVADEPDDFDIIIRDAPGILHFFNAPRAYEFDQSRLPYYISAPFLYFLGENALIPLRLLFLSFHVLYLVFSFKLARVLTENRTAAWGYVLLVAASCYLASFSIFAISTSDNLYLLFHLMSLYCFLKSYAEQQRNGVFPRCVLLATLFGLCIASKLFGVLLLAAVLIFHFLNRAPGHVFSISSVHPNRLIRLGAMFFGVIVAVNLLPLHDRIRLVAAFLLCVGYLWLIGRYLAGESRGRFTPARTGLVRMWVAILITSFNLTLIFSPVYLNLRNLLATITWFGEWNSGLLVARSHYYDMLVIVAMKYGLIALAALLVVSAAALTVRKTQRIGLRTSPLLLLCLVSAIHMIVVSLTKHKVTWYPLAIFPFLYLPVVWLWSQASAHRMKRLALVTALGFAVIYADNAVRYFRWFPYGHFDGAQYGREYIGWNRAGLVSFEILPQLGAYFQSLDDGRGPIDVVCLVVEVPLYNEWVAELLKHYFGLKGETAFRFGATDLERAQVEQADYALTSPIYYPRAEERLPEWGFEKRQTLSIKGLAIAAVWERL
jgi:hypothetical protein